MSATASVPRLQCYHRQIPAVKTYKPQTKTVLQHSPREDLKYVVHSFLRVEERPESPQTINEELQIIPVTVFDGSSGKKVSLNISSTDTIGKLKEAFQKEMPYLKGSLDLAFNGKQCDSKTTMCDLNVKSGATFVTFQRCIGG
uniref:Ubiquitin-like domain-containing protein n=1 Tax=Astyanax mexicanus TaxID=7994 RepID=A0A3B1K457_ASTMX